MSQWPVADHYLAVRAESPLAAGEDLEHQLRAVIARARASHPNLLVDDVEFVEFVATRLDFARMTSADAHLADLYLACATVLGVAGAAEQLEVRCISQIPKAISRIDRSPMFVTEIQQRVRDKLVVGGRERRPRIAEYGARGSLAAFVRVAAIREALMEKRTTGRQRLAAYDEPHGVVDGDATLEMVRREYHAEFQIALRAALATLERHERSALRLSYLDNLSIDQIGRLFHVHRATAARWITRAQERVRGFTRQAMQQRLHLTDSEAESLLTDLMSVDALSSGMLASSIKSRPRAA